ncbi:Protein of unknown function [Oryzisolibacter propanilivorax]|uniref:DUF3037 domain-containing protein n=1 Tax=Oryzisolibacter propanilivorax TaxID=1527607 RepID=A0A1G9PDV4_9BURK|nr:DUF3037 domain-containing protein [Oryzisolibacter propanilivorax]SDL96970.1 Protein of unknown function [Oryzisolibacter propanilivorax]
MPVPELQLYDYALVRVVPRVERGEFINAGAIVSCQRTGYLAAAIDLDEARLRALDPWADVAQVARHLQALADICAGEPHAGPIAQLPHRARFHWLTARRSAIIQTSPVHTGRCEDAQALLAHLMDCMVRPLILRACPGQSADGGAP